MNPGEENASTVKEKETSHSISNKTRLKKQAQNEDQEERRNIDKDRNRNVIIFTGRALVEILRDQTMQKSFMTLAYISDMLVGSEISPP